LLAAWDVLDFDCGALEVPMCVGARLLTFELDDDIGALSKGHLLLLVENAPNLENLSAAFGADIFVEKSILQRFAKLRALSVWLDDAPSTCLGCIRRATLVVAVDLAVAGCFAAES
jgi:hypothetical protein